MASHFHFVAAQKQCPLWVISGHGEPFSVMSALPPKADIRQRVDVRFVPKADISIRCRTDS